MRQIVTRFVALTALAALPLLNGCVAALIGGAAAGGYLAGEDRRPASILTDDQAIEFRISNRVTEKFPLAHVNSTSFNRLVLLTGEAPNAEAKAEIEKIVKEVPNVRGTYNELVVSPSTALSDRTRDSFLTSKVKARFVDRRKFNPVHVKVVTERETVYLMGIVKPQEADDATEIARTTEGVKRVVRVFEVQG